MDYSARRADPEKVKKLKTAVAWEGWDDVVEWYRDNTPWVTEDGIQNFVRSHQEELDQLGRHYYEELKKKLNMEKTTNSQQTDEGKSQITESTISEMHETI